MILPGRFLYAVNKTALKAHVFEGLDPSLAAKIRSGDIFIGGRNFGCGSARPAARAMQNAGIVCIIAKSFSRTFLRSAIDTGVPILECDLLGLVKDGDVVSVDVEKAIVTLPSQAQVTGKAFPEFILDIFRAGGIITYTRDALARL
jgi:3-isopropylmalate/(R)-2-methylmalate dehydratase small subunit